MQILSLLVSQFFGGRGGIGAWKIVCQQFTHVGLQTNTQIWHVTLINHKQQT